jgi:hypothetical protein
MGRYTDIDFNTTFAGKLKTPMFDLSKAIYNNNNGTICSVV